MINTVSLSRLDRVKTKSRNGKRRYETFKMPDSDMQKIMEGVRYALGLIDAP